MVNRSLRTTSAVAALVVGLSASPLLAQTSTTTTGADPAANVPADATQATASAIKDVGVPTVGITAPGGI